MENKLVSQLQTYQHLDIQIKSFEKSGTAKTKSSGQRDARHARESHLEFEHASKNARENLKESKRQINAVRASFRRLLHSL